MPSIEQAWEAWLSRSGKSYDNLTPAQVMQLAAFRECFVAGFVSASPEAPHE